MPITGEQLALFYFTVLFSGILWMPAWLLLSIFTPKKLLHQYFKEPHFTLTETVLLAQFPGFLFRTVIFSWAVLIPKLGEKRRIENIKECMPNWYRMALLLLVMYALFILLTAAVVTPILVFFDF